VLGADGETKLRNEAAKEQTARLKMEGVKFRGKRVDIGQHPLKLNNIMTAPHRSTFAKPDDAILLFTIGCLLKYDDTKPRKRNACCVPTLEHVMH
jgi:hypothetical protein